MAVKAKITCVCNICGIVAQISPNPTSGCIHFRRYSPQIMECDFRSPPVDDLILPGSASKR